MVQLTIFGYAIDTEIRDIPTLVVDRSRTRLSRAFTEALGRPARSSSSARVHEPREALSEMRAGRARVDASCSRPTSSGGTWRGEPAPVQVLIDGSDSNLASQAQAAALGRRDRPRRAGRRRRAATRPPAFDVRPRYLYNPDGRSEPSSCPGLAGIILQLVAMVLTAFAIVRERERGTLEQLLVTPISSLALTLGKILPAILIGAGETILVLARHGVGLRACRSPGASGCSPGSPRSSCSRASRWGS